MSAVVHEERRYLRGGTVAHLLGPVPHQPYTTAYCGRSPQLFDAWLGTGTQEEYERAATLPTCRGCLRMLQVWAKRLAELETTAQKVRAEGRRVPRRDDDPPHPA